MSINYSKLSQECFKKGDYKGYLTNARKQYEETKNEEDLKAYKKVEEDYKKYKEIEQILKIDENDYYKILGVTKKATISEIKKAFRELAHKYHPNKTNIKEATTAMRMIQKAYFELNTEEKKNAYDGKKNDDFVDEISDLGDIRDNALNMRNRRFFRFGNVQFSLGSFDISLEPNIPIMFQDRLYNSIYRNIYGRRRGRRARIDPRHKNILVIIYIIFIILFIYVF